MKKLCVILVVVMLFVAVQAMAVKVAARATSVTIYHPTSDVFQAYPGNSGGTDVAFMGYKGTNGDVISSVPGVLSIVPGGPKWENFVAAANVTNPANYTIKNIVLVKETPEIVQCNDVFPKKKISQQGTPNIRTWWPLMYEVPSTTWTLTIVYGTTVAVQFPGENVAGYVHTEVWSWHVDANLTSLKNLLELFHEIPFGKDEVPLISDERLYPVLQAKLDAVIAAYDAGDLVTAGLILGDFDMEVMDACLSISPASPSVTGPGTGIAQTEENPACCKILADVEYIGKTTGIFQAVK